MKKLTYLMSLIFALNFIFGCNDIEDPVAPEENLKHNSEQSLLKSNPIPGVCEEKLDALKLYEDEYANAVKDLEKIVTKKEPVHIEVALENVATTFEALQSAHNQVMVTCSEPPVTLDPDEYEPNNTNPQARSLGEINSDEQLSWQANFHNPEVDKHDFYWIQANDGPAGLPPFPEHFRINVQFFGLYMECFYRIYLYDNYGTELNSTSFHGLDYAELSFLYDGLSGNDDTKIFVIEIRHESGEPMPYTLRISFYERL